MRDHDVTTLTAAELEHARRELPPAWPWPGPAHPSARRSWPASAPSTPSWPDAAPRPARPESTRMTNQPAPEDAARITDVLREHQQWSVFWDPKYHLWRAAEDDPDSDLYAESPDAATVIRYITAHS